MLSTKNVVVVEKSSESKFMTYGVQLAMVISGEVRVSPQGVKRVIFNMEGPEVKSAGFEPDPASKKGGKVGHVEFAGYIKENVADDQGLKDFLERVSIVANKLGVIDAVNAINAPTTEAFIEQLIPIIRGKFAWWAVTGREYAKKDSDKIGITLGLRRYGFIASEGEGKEHLREFDKGNKYDYRPFDTPSVDGSAPDAISEAFGAVNPNMPAGEELPW